MNHGTSKFPLRTTPTKNEGLQGGIHYYTSFPAFNGKSLLGAKIIFAFSSFHTSMFLKCWAILGRWKPKSLDAKRNQRIVWGGECGNFLSCPPKNKHTCPAETAHISDWAAGMDQLSTPRQMSTPVDISPSCCVVKLPPLLVILHKWKNLAHILGEKLLNSNH